MARLLQQPPVTHVASLPFGSPLASRTADAKTPKDWVRSTIRLLFQGHSFYRSPVRFGALLWALAVNLKSQVEILRLLALRPFQELIRLDPIFPFKYLTRGYLVSDLLPSERAACFVHHYRCLQANLPALILQQVLYREAVLLEKEVNGRCLSVHLSLARSEVREGELMLVLRVDGVDTYYLQFTIVPGGIVKSDAADVIMISRLQGMKGCYDEIRLATKVFREIAPPALLLAVLHGIAQLCGIDQMAGVSAASQFCFDEQSAESFQSAYDNFWVELGAERISRTFFLSSIPPVEKSLESVGNGHKSRTRKKREMKKQIADDVFHLLLGTRRDQLHSLVTEEVFAEHI